MKLRVPRKTLNTFLVFIIAGSSLITTGVAIYFFGFKLMTKTGDSPNNQENVQPVFEQSEINWVTQEKSIILSRFQEVLTQKRPGIRFNYFVDNLDYPQRIKVNYLFQNKVVNWVYELQY